MTLGKHKDVLLFHSAKTKIDQNLEATERRPDMARVSHFVELKNFGRAASPRLRQPLQLGHVQTGGHDDKMVNIDLSRDIKGMTRCFRQDAKIANFCSSGVRPFLPT